MRRYFCLALITLCAVSGMNAASEIRQHLESVSDVILVGTIVVAPEMISGSAPLPSSDPKPYWSDSIARIKISKILKGTFSQSDSPLIALRIPMVAAESLRPSLSEALEPFQQGRKIIFFLQDRRLRQELGRGSLNNEDIHLVAFDPYFSALPYNEALELEIAKKKQ